MAKLGTDPNSTAARLAAALRGLRVQPHLHKFNPAQWQHYVDI
ncbi:MAG: hypothetical protein ACLQVY_23515 [Limisphaerales bacterium]